MKNIFFGMLLISLLSLPFLGCGNGKSHEGVNKKVSKEFSNQLKINQKSTFTDQAEGIDLVKIVDYLPNGYSKLGDTDYTDVIQDVLDKHSTVEFPNFPILVNDKGLRIRSNSKLYFQKESLLKLKSSAKVLYAILNIAKVENVSIYSPTIEGDRYRRVNPEDKKGEWGMGIWIQESKNISVFNAKVTHCWGDGIYIGGGRDIVPNDSIYIHRPIIDENRRNGISITSGKNIRIIEPVVSNSRGKSPESGIDIEPNSNTSTLNNIYIERPKTFNNQNHGIVVALTSLVGELDNHVNIEIVNHIDEYSTYGFTMADFRPKKDKEVKKLTGNVIIKNAIWKFNKQAYALGNTSDLYPPVNFFNCKVYSDVNNVNVVDEGMQYKMKFLKKKGYFFQ
ncbi:right-handed parallel beta-helix repeat-containing protein [Ulvibacter litoralis]|uniref:Right handed beta helix region n=1 Tax=Ulvibacter litoralis TaxID=227084 RepID=A0A1G7HPV6_9FLAO|nr:right-handed parallel beta-helix repeat-containing protein [Ulvibacter litoralis]GHC58483.1 hypothetical protein GCM10008083_24090 [Ulvibacter litoralis]SDF02029.1 Right handed beta helix region [Ulvibacter litoralis]